MQQIGLHRLLTGPSPAPGRIFFHELWHRGHRNPRMARLLPRLPRLDRYLITISDRRVVRALQSRALFRTRRLRNRLIVGAGNRRYDSMFTFNTEHLPWFGGRTVIDVDEPTFAEREVELLNRPNVRAVVVTTERLADRYAEAGLKTPTHVIPQGVDLATLSSSDVDEVARRHRDGDGLVVGYISAWFHTKGERNYDPIYDLDHVLELWDGIRARVPDATLWLIGQASARARALCAERDDVTLFDEIPFGGALPYVANFDVALFPRRTGHSGPFLPVKLIEYMGVGAPIVSYDLEATEILGESGAGLVVRTPREFVDAVARLASDEHERRRLGDAGRGAAKGFEWSHLVDRYRTEVFDRYLG